MIGRSIRKVSSVRSAICRHLVGSVFMGSPETGTVRRGVLMRSFCTTGYQGKEPGTVNPPGNMIDLENEVDFQLYYHMKDRHCLVLFFVKGSKDCDEVISKFHKRAILVKKEINFLNVDMEKYPMVAQKFAVSSAPHAFLFYNTIKVGEFDGKNATDYQLDGFFKPLM